MNFGYDILEKFNANVALLYRMSHEKEPVEAIAHVLPKLIEGSMASVWVMGPGYSSQALSETPLIDQMSNLNMDIMSTHPRHDRTDLMGKVVCISDLLAKNTWHQRDLYHAMSSWARLEDDMGVDLLLDDGRLLKTCVMRDSRSFSESDRMLFTLLLPHLKAVLRMHPVGPEAHLPTHIASSQEKPQSVTVDGLHGMGLTPREQDVLYWISEGKTNAEAADILGIASGTVRIHLLRIYQKLGVENRHGATRKALEKLYPERF